MDMEIVIFIIVILAFIIKSQKKAADQAKETGNNKPNQPPTRPIATPNQQRTVATPNQQRPRVTSDASASGKTAAQIKEEIWSRLSEEAKAKMSNRDTYQQMTFDDTQKKSGGEDMSAAGQVNKRRMEERNTSILDRAKSNNLENAKDVTLDTLEVEHNHSERVAPALHHHPEEDLRESMLGSVEDLMAKGYDGTLCFERDFLGEAMDMIGRFTAPSEIKELSSNQ
jgi:hypothetical protein